MLKLGSFIRKPKEKRKVYDWQDLAIQIIKDLEVLKTFRPSVFKACKVDFRAAQFAYVDCMELDKKGVKYFFKVYSAIRKKQGVQ